MEPRVTVRDGETREFDELLSRSTVGRVLTAALSQRSTDGAEAELQQYFGLAANQIALEPLETRAVTAGTFGRGIKSAAHYPGDFPGRRRFVLGRRNADCRSWGSNLHGFDHGCNRPHSGKEFRRRRNDGCFQCFGTVSQAGAGVIFLEHRGRGEAGGMEDALRSNLTQALSSKFDNILLNDSTAGLLGGGLTAPNDPSSVVDWPGYKGLLTDQVDGHYASMPDQVRMLIGSKTYTHMETLYRVLAANGGVNESSYELLVRKSGGVRISSHIVAPSANIQGLIAVRRPSALHTVMPLWRGITLIPDRVTKAANGQVQLTAVALYGLSVLRSAGFGRLKVKLA